MSWLAMSTIQSIPKARPTVPELWFELTVNQKHLLLMCDGRVCVCVCAGYANPVAKYKHWI